jgi:malate synthase
MKKNESSLPADLQAMLQETHKVQSQDMTKVLHSAVTKLGKAKKTLQDARASRMQLHNVWKTYLAASAEKWQEFCKDFEKQDNDLAQQVMSATDAVKAAQEGLEASKKEAKEVEDLDSDSKNDMALEISDEESQEVLDSKGQALKEGLNLMLTNLESLKEKAELAAEESAAKRPRKRPPDGSTEASLRSFGVPGQ